MKSKHKELLEMLRRHPIGTEVTVEMQMFRLESIPDKDIRWDPEKCSIPFRAWVTGAKWLCDGVYHRSRGSFDDYEQGYLKVSKKTPVLLVRRAMFSREIPVPVAGVKPVNEEQMTGDPPLTFAYTRPWTERDRETLRAEMATIPRDAEGRWMKMPSHMKHPGSI